MRVVLMPNETSRPKICRKSAIIFKYCGVAVISEIVEGLINCSVRFDTTLCLIYFEFLFLFLFVVSENRKRRFERSFGGFPNKDSSPMLTLYLSNISHTKFKYS